MNTCVDYNARVKNPQLEALCSCQDVSVAYLEAIEKYNDDKLTWEGKLFRIKQNYDNYSRFYEAWQNKSSVNINGFVKDYSMFNGWDVNQPFFTDRCFDRPSRGQCTATVDMTTDTNGTCQSQAVSNGRPSGNEYQDVGGRQPCSGKWNNGCLGKGDENYSRQQRVQCTRTQQSIDNAKSRYYDACPRSDLSDPTSPVFGGGDPNQRGAFAEPPNKPIFPSANIQCCSQIFGDITTSGNVNYKNITQTCQTRIGEAIQNETNKPVLSPPTSTPPPPSPPPSTGSSTTTSPPSTTTPPPTSTTLPVPIWLWVVLSFVFVIPIILFILNKYEFI